MHCSPESEVQDLFDQIPIATLMADLDGRVVYMNSDCATLFGYTAQEATNLSVEDLVPSHLRSLHVEYRQAYAEAPTRRTMVGKRIVVGVRKDQSEISVEVGLGTLRTAAGLRVVATILDISRRRSDEAKLRVANAQLARKNADLDEFVYMASHDLQEPIRKLISFSELLPGDLGRDLPERAEMDVKFITESAYRMRRLIQDLLTLSRVGKSSMTVEHVDLNQCVAEVIEILRDSIEQCGAVVEVADLPVVQADPSLMTQLFQNLIGNALKFVAGDARPNVAVTLESSDGGPVFGVKDNGIGIAPEFHEQVFTSFRRLHPRSEFDGTGIGLSICRKAVERHGGRIWVDSEPGKGAHFRFTLGEVGTETEC